MELIGKVFGPGPAGEVVVRADRPWRWGEGVRLVDRRGRAMGRVEQIVGPASAPFLVLRPLDPKEGSQLGARLKGSDVYVEEIPAEPKEQPAFREGRRKRAPHRSK